MATRLCKEFWRAAFSPKYLVVTNTFACVTLLSAADIVQQIFMGASFTASFPPHRYYDHYDYEHKRYHERTKSLDEEDEVRRINWRRTRRVASIGFITGPMNTYWYRWLESVVKGPISLINVAIKVLIDIASTPAFDSTFIIGVATQEGKSIVEAVGEYKSKFWTIFMTSVCVWIPTQTINFWLVPQRFRVLYVALVTFFYNSMLNYIKHDNQRNYTTLRTLVGPSKEELERIRKLRALVAPLPITATVVESGVDNVASPITTPHLKPSTKAARSLLPMILPSKTSSNIILSDGVIFDVESTADTVVEPTLEVQLPAELASNSSESSKEDSSNDSISVATLEPIEAQ